MSIKYSLVICVVCFAALAGWFQSNWAGQTEGERVDFPVNLANLPNSYEQFPAQSILEVVRNRSSKVSGEDFHKYMNQAKASWDLGDFEQVEQLLHIALAIDNAQTSAHRALGLFYLEVAGNIPQAEEHLYTAVLLEKSSLGPLRELLQIYSGDLISLPLIEHRLKVLLFSRPDQFELHQAVAAFWFDRGYPDLAEHIIEQFASHGVIDTTLADVVWL